MPLYDFHCEQCETKFEVRASIKEKQAGLQPECPTCHSQAVRQVVTAGASRQRWRQCVILRPAVRLRL
jgi:putative FmdB family regulatory protein